VQQCRTCNTVIVLNPEAKLPQLCAFARWLPKHAALVKSITATAIAEDERGLNVHGFEWEAHWEVAQQLLQHALQAVVSPPQPALEAAPAASGFVPDAVESGITEGASRQHGQQQGLRLTSFSSDFAATAGVLAALPAHSLTFLHLDRRYRNDGMPAAGVALPAALARLTNLRHMRLEGDGHGLPSRCLAALSQLRGLTNLSIGGGWYNEQGTLQQLLAGALSLQVLTLDIMFCTSHQPLDLRRLTNLEELQVFELPGGFTAANAAAAPTPKLL
jgi:hypothetical protein